MRHPVVNALNGDLPGSSVHICGLCIGIRLMEIPLLCFVREFERVHSPVKAQVSYI